MLAPLPAIATSFFAGVDVRYLTVLGVDQGASVNGLTLALTGGHEF